MKKDRIDIQTRRLTRLYQQAEAEIIAELEGLLSSVGGESNFFIKTLRVMEKNVRQVLAELSQGNTQWVTEAVTDIYKVGVQSARTEMKEVGDALIAGMGTINQNAAQVIAEDVNYRLTEAVATISRQIHGITNKAKLQGWLQGGELGYQTWRQTAEKISEGLRDHGVACMVDRAGKRWGMKAYSRMLARTSLMNCHNVARENEFLRHGEDLVIISAHPNTCERCAPWQNRVLSLAGNTLGYPTMEEAREAGLFHPNCRHTSTLYIPNEGETAVDTQRKEEVWRAETAAREAARRQAEEQKRRETEEAKRWKVNRQKQARHVAGTKEYREYVKVLAKQGKKPSYLTISTAKLKRILEDLRSAEASSDLIGDKRRVVLDSVVGMYYDSNGGGPYESNVLMVHLSKTGAHAYPAKPKRR